MMTKAAAIEREQSQIEYDIAQRLHRMEDVEIDTGRKIFSQDVVEEMADRDPDRFCLAVYLCSQQRASQANQGCGILTDLRKAAISSLIRKHYHNLRTVARQRVEDREPMEVRHAVA